MNVGLNLHYILPSSWLCERFLVCICAAMAFIFFRNCFWNEHIDNIVIAYHLSVVSLARSMLARCFVCIGCVSAVATNLTVLLLLLLFLKLHVAYPSIIQADIHVSSNMPGRYNIHKCIQSIIAQNPYGSHSRVRVSVCWVESDFFFITIGKFRTMPFSHTHSCIQNMHANKTYYIPPYSYTPYMTSIVASALDELWALYLRPLKRVFTRPAVNYLRTCCGLVRTYPQIDIRTKQTKTVNGSHLVV